MLNSMTEWFAQLSATTKAVVVVAVAVGIPAGATLVSSMASGTGSDLPAPTAGQVVQSEGSYGPPPAGTPTTGATAEDVGQGSAPPALVATATANAQDANRTVAPAGLPNGGSLPIQPSGLGGDSNLTVPPAGLSAPGGSPAPGLPSLSGALAQSTASTAPSAGASAGNRSVAQNVAPASGTTSGVVNNCPSNDLVPLSNATAYLSGKRMCVAANSQRWQEFHSGNGDLIDWKLGPGHPRDPRIRVGSWTATGNTVTHNYGAQSYSYNVCVDATNAQRVGQNIGSVMVLAGVGSMAGVQFQATVEVGEGACL